MNILGLGMDIVETKRIAESIERFGDRFLQRVFLEDEVAYAHSMKFPHLHLAARFAAKEAGAKALGTGISRGVTWREIEVVREPGGRPALRFHGRAAEMAERMNARRAALSITHTRDMAMASVVLEDANRQGGL